MPLHSTRKPLGLASLFVRIACLPDERHITGPRCGTAIVDKDRVYAGHPDVHLVEEVDGHAMWVPAVLLNPWVMAAPEYDSKPTHCMPVLGICCKLT